VEAFASNLDHDVDVYYVVHRFIDGRDDPSEVRTIRVTAQRASFPVPRIKEATGNQLEVSGSGWIWKRPILMAIHITID